MSLSRREFLERAAALGVTVAVLPSLGCAPKGGGVADDGFEVYAWDGEPGPATAFEHGVASGDPLSDAVLLWTRVSPPEGTTGEVDVFLEVDTDPAFTTRVAVGWFTTTADQDWTLTVDQTELDPATTYYFRFSALGRTSSIGRTRTLPSGATERVRIAACSCSNYGFGYFHAYRHMAKRADLDLFLHLGDYIYEHASDGFGHVFGTFRPLDPPNEIVSLSDYRRRYALYRRDPDLQELHRQTPIVHGWDDHEFTDNPKIGGAVNHQPDEEGSWDDRKAAALQAVSEWIPHRLREGGRIFRELVLGDLAHVILVDRQRRFLWPEPTDGDLYLGDEQTTWLLERVAGVTAPWLVLASATSFTSRNPDGDLGSSFDGSPWDPASRRQVLDAVADAGIENFVAVVGDIHRAEALDVAHDPTTYDRDTGEGSEGVEFACGSIGSPGFPTTIGETPHFFWSDAMDRSYLLLDVTRDELRAEFWGFADALKFEPTLPPETLLKAYRCAAGSHHLVETTEATTPRADAAPLAP